MHDNGNQLRMGVLWTFLPAAHEMFVWTHLKVPPLDLQRYRAGTLEGAGHLHIPSLPNTYIFRDFSKSSFDVKDRIIHYRLYLIK